MNKELANKLFLYKDGNLYWKSKFSKYSSIKIGQEAGYIDSDGYKRTKINKKLYGNHQLIYLMFYGFIPPQIDHANQNKLDNTIENLRIATKSQNQHNKTIQKNNELNQLIFIHYVTIQKNNGFDDCLAGFYGVQNKSNTN